MNVNRDQFAVVLATLRARFRAGEWIEGESLTVGDLAAQAGVSPTPIREALSRLSGEGLVDDHRSRGYHARHLDGIDLADLYLAQRLLARAVLAVAGCGAAKRVSAPSAPDFFTQPVRAWEIVFEALMRNLNNSFLNDANRRLADQLAPARLVEPEILGETPADFEPLVAALRSADWPAVAVALDRRFQRRHAAVEDLVMRLRLRRSKYNISI